MKLLLLVLPLAFELVYARPIADQPESVIIEVCITPPFCNPIPDLEVRVERIHGLQE